LPRRPERLLLALLALAGACKSNPTEVLSGSGPTYFDGQEASFFQFPATVVDGGTSTAVTVSTVLVSDAPGECARLGNHVVRPGAGWLSLSFSVKTGLPLQPGTYTLWDGGSPVATGTFVRLDDACAPSPQRLNGTVQLTQVNPTVNVAGTVQGTLADGTPISGFFGAVPCGADLPLPTLDGGVTSDGGTTSTPYTCGG
jgi:hypothetical protein